MITVIFLQTSTSGIMSFLPMILIIIVIYFFMIRPQMQKAKEHKKYIEALKRGDRVITSAGIHGKIVDVNDTTFLIEVESGHKIRFEKSAVSLDASKPLNVTK